MTFANNSIAGSYKFSQVDDVQGKNAIMAANAALVPMTVDLLDPDSMLSFFSAQMSDVRQKLGAAMNDQETRNDRIKTLAALESDIARFKEKGIKPGDPGFDTFKVDVDKARALMGDSLEGTKLGELIDSVKPGTEVTFLSQNTNEWLDYKDKHPEAVMWQSDGGHVTFSTGKGLNPAEMDSLVQQVKGYRDSLQNDNAMNMIRVQQLVESSSQIMNLCSNVMKKLSDAAMSPINNMR